MCIPLKNKFIWRKKLLHRSTGVEERKQGIIACLDHWHESLIKPILKMAKSDPDPEMQAIATETLKIFPEDFIFDTIAEILKTTDRKQVWLNAAKNLTEYGSHKTLMLLTRMTKERAQDWLDEAVEILSEHSVTFPEVRIRPGDEDRGEIIEWAIDLLLHGSEIVKPSISKFISHTGGLFAINPLLDAQPETESQRNWLAETLSEISALFGISEVDELRRRALK